MPDTLTHKSTLQEVKDFLSEVHSGSDADITDADAESVHRSIQANNSWRRSLPIDEQIELSTVPVSTKPQVLDPENVPAGVTVVEPGKDNSARANSTPELVPGNGGGSQ